MLELQDLVVDFGGLRALDEATVDIETARVAAILGPSGSGKSTLLRTVAGLQRPDSGTVRFGGVDITHVAPHRRNFGLMFQDYALFPHRTVAGNVAFGLEMQGSADPTRVDAVLDMVGLAGYGGRAVGTLSGGEQQRVGLARALAPSPQLLMLDEPLGALDRSLRDRLMVELRSLFTSLGLTVLYVTHDQDEAFTVADEIVVMDRGKIVQHTTPEGLWAKPADAFVAEFLGFLVVDGEVSDGMLQTEFGAVAHTEGDSTRVAIRTDRAFVDIDGPVSATVVGVRFTEGRHIVQAETSSGLHLSAAAATRPLVGTSVNIRLADDALVPLPE